MIICWNASTPRCPCVCVFFRTDHQTGLDHLLTFWHLEIESLRETVNQILTFSQHISSLNKVKVFKACNSDYHLNCFQISLAQISNQSNLIKLKCNSSLSRMYRIDFGYLMHNFSDKLFIRFIYLSFIIHHLVFRFWIL